MAEEQPIFTEPVGRTPTPSAPRPADASPAFQALGNLGANMARLGIVLYRQDQEKAVLDAEIALAKGFADLTQQASEETDWNKAVEVFKAGSSKLEQDTAAMAKDGRTADAIRRSFTGHSLRASATVTAQVMKRKAADYIAGMNNLAETTSRAALADPRGEEGLEEYFQAYQKAVAGGVSTGFISGDDGAEAVWKFRESVSSAVARGMINRNPMGAVGALSDSERLPHLDPGRREELLGMALKAAGSMDGMLSRAAKEKQEEVAANLWTVNAEGKLTRQMVVDQKDALPLSEYKQLLKAVNTPPAERNDPQAYNQLLTGIVNGDDMHASILQANADGLITGPTARTLIEMQRTSGGPASPFKATLKYLRGSLGATTLLSKGDIGQERRLEEATLEFTEWARAHPSAEQGELRKQADAMIRRFSLVDFTDRTIAQPLPYGVTRARNEIGMDDLIASKQSLEKARSSGILSDEQYEAERRRLAVWIQDVAARQQALGNTEEGNGRNRR